MVRDELDLKRCVDYIHVNPLKHGLVSRVGDWRWSSFHRYVQLGEYSPEPSELMGSRRTGDPSYWTQREHAASRSSTLLPNLSRYV